MAPAALAVDRVVEQEVVAELDSARVEQGVRAGVCVLVMGNPVSLDRIECDQINRRRRGPGNKSVLAGAWLYPSK